MKSCKLKDEGKDAYFVRPVAAWSGFGATAGNGTVKIHVRDIALQRIDPTSTGADHTHVLDRYRSEILKIANEKYERDEIESDDDGIAIIRITYEDLDGATWISEPPPNGDKSPTR